MKIFYIFTLLYSIIFYPFEGQNYEHLLDQYLEAKGYTRIEGNVCSRNTDQPLFIKNLLRSNSFISSIGEVGFNAGHSSLIFLDTKPNVHVYSFDIASHVYVHDAKHFINEHFPNRHFLIKGDSTQTVPLFYATNPSIKFDLIFIDGGHRFEIALSDIQNMYNLAHKDTIVIIDDAHPGSNVQKAIAKCKEMKLIKDTKLEISNDGGSKAWLVCKYNYQ